MTSGWKWRHARGTARRQWSFLSFGSFGIAIPWLTLAIILLFLYEVSGTLTAAEGVLFDLPETGLSEGETTELVALVLAMPNGALVFFDDARYLLDDRASSATLSERLGESVRKSGRSTLLVLADRMVGSGDLMNFAALARKSGVRRILFANKRSDLRGE